jgi:hypothetical protein
MTAWNRSVASLYSRLIISAVVVGINEYNDPIATVTNDASVVINIARNSKVSSASAVKSTSKTADHEHQLTTGRLHAEAS